MHAKLEIRLQMPRYETITVLAIVHLQSCFILSEWKNMWRYTMDITSTYRCMDFRRNQSDYKIRQELVSDSHFCKTIK